MKILARFNPSNSNLSNSYYSSCWGYVGSDNREYAILGAHNGTYIYDITSYSEIVQVGFVPSPDPIPFSNLWREMKVFSHYAYVVSELEGSGIQIIDLQNLPDSIHYIGNYEVLNHLSTHTISQSGPYLYLNGANNTFNVGVTVLDLTQNPEQPILRGKWNSNYVHDSRIINDTIWACNIITGNVSIIDARNKDRLFTIGDWINLPNPSSPHNIDLTGDRKYAFVTDENSGPGKLKIWDVSDINNVVLVNSWSPLGFESSIIHNVEIQDTLSAIAYYTAGVRVLNISNPENPVETAFYDTFPDNNNTSFNGCWGVFIFPSGKIIGSDRKYGLFILEKDFTGVELTPKADFEANKRVDISIGDTISFYDFSGGLPNKWDWTITGPQNFTASEQNPKFIFTKDGLYTVKLRVSNSQGSDSLVKVNYIIVSPPPLTPFGFLGSAIHFINVNQMDTGVVDIYWTKSSTNPLVNYKFRMQKLGENVFKWLSSNNNGIDTFITLRKSFLDSVALEFGTVGDSVLIQSKVFAYNWLDSLESSNQLLLIVKRITVGITPISNEIPNVFKLENNYPNPFNPETNIRYQLPKASFVSIKLYDIIGREVRTLVNERHDEGYYNYRFNANGLSSSVYFYKIQAGEFSDIKRMMLIK